MGGGGLRRGRPDDACPFTGRLLSRARAPTHIPPHVRTPTTRKPKGREGAHPPPPGGHRNPSTPPAPYPLPHPPPQPPGLLKSRMILWNTVPS